MKIPTLNQIRNQIKTQSQSKIQTKFFPFWDMNENSYLTVRFLPDGDPNNTFFWVEKHMINLPFSGIKGTSTLPVVVAVPSASMWDEKNLVCPITAKISSWWGTDRELVARRYWRKKTFILQGLVEKSTKINLFSFTTQVMDIIKSILMDPEVEYNPVDFDHGRDFRLHKTRKGDFANYSTSKWSLKTRPLSDQEREIVQTQGLIDLKTLLPPKPTKADLELIDHMFEMSLKGEEFDPIWGYKPVYSYTVLGEFP